jgi:protein transport protein SEC23
MKSLTNATNGFMIISDSFMTAIFKQSFLRTLVKDEQGWLKMGFNGTFEVLVSWSLGYPRGQTDMSRLPKN